MAARTWMCSVMALCAMVLGCSEGRSRSTTGAGGAGGGGGGGNPAPSLLAVSPTQGPLAGGQAATLSGSNFVTGAAVSFAGNPATNVTVVSSSTCTCTTPAGSAGPVNVTLTNPDTQSSTLTNGYTYTSSLFVTAVSPNTGDTGGGTPVSITGGGFATGATVLFGSNQATNVVVVSGTVITASTPAGAVGSVNVTVTNPGPTSATLTSGYTYTAGSTTPSVSNVSPAQGPAPGGTPITLSGANFQTGATVTIGGALATNVSVAGSGTITCDTPRAPEGTTGALAVTVTNPGGASGTNTSPGFTYLPVPVESLSTVGTRPDVTVDGNGTVHVVWEGANATTTPSILHVRSTDGGATWSSPATLNAGTATSTRPRVAARGSTVFVVWNEASNLGTSIERNYSTDGGQNWSGNGQLVSTGNWLPNPDVAIDAAGTVLVAYEFDAGTGSGGGGTGGTGGTGGSGTGGTPGGGSSSGGTAGGGSGGSGTSYPEIRVIAGAAAGPFGSSVTVANGTVAHRLPSVDAGSSGFAVVAWWTATNGWPLSGNPPYGFDAQTSRTTDSGSTWSTPVNLTSGASDDAFDASVAIHGTTVVVCWAQTAWAGTYSVHAARSTDSGASFGTAQTLASGYVTAIQPDVAASGNGTFTCCFTGQATGSAPFDVFTTRSVDGGASFATAINLSQSSGASREARIAGGAGGFFCRVWEDDSANPGTADIVAR